jgi:hypothetical protein
VANLPFQNDKIKNLNSHSAKHLQMMRSYYASSLLTTLVGQTQPNNIEQNLAVLNVPRLTEI